MSGAIEDRVRPIVARRLADWRQRLVGQIRSAGGLVVGESDDGVVVQGRRARARWLRDARLRWIGGWL